MKTLRFALIALGLAACGEAVALSGEGTVIVNEVVPANANGCADEAGEKDDWVELYNPGDTAVDLGGWYVSDDAATPKKATLPAGLTIGAKGFLVLWPDDVPTQGPAHLAFKLKAEGESIVLSRPDGTVADQYAWTAAPDDVSYARLPDGTGAFVVCATPTCGAANDSTCAR